MFSRIAFLLPFNADKQGDPTGAIATDFYMGAQLALDSLVKLGYEGNVFIHDVGNDSTDLVPILKKLFIFLFQPQKFLLRCIEARMNFF